MRRAAAVAMLLLLGACSSSGRSAPDLATLTRLLVTSADVRLPGYTATTPDGEQQPHTTITTRYFDRAGFTDSGLHSSDVSSQLAVTLTAPGSRTAARAAVDAAVSAAVSGLRGPATSTPISLGAHGREVVGRAKGDGAQQHGFYFVEGDVAVSVILSSAGDQPETLARDVARAQDAKLRKAA